METMKEKRRVFIKICGLDGDVSVCDVRYYESLKDFALSRLSEEGFDVTAEELYECEPYGVDRKVLEFEMQMKGLIDDSTRIKDVKVIKAVTYDAPNADEFQEVEVLLL